MSLRSPGVTDRWLDPDRLTPLHVTAIYVAFGLSLLFVSDVLWPAWIEDPGLLRPLQGVKGAVEVLVTGGVIYVLVGRMERQLERSEQRYRNLIESSPAPINLFDGDGTTVWGNDAVLELLGLDDREALVGRSIFEFIHPDDRESAADELDRVIERDETVGPSQFRLVRDDGEVRYVQVKTTAGWYGDERVGQAVVVDVTELRETENELRRERNFVWNALDELRDVFFVVDRAGRLKCWNARLSDVTGYDDEELSSMTATDLVPPEEQRRARDAIETALDTGRSFVEADLVTSDGERRRYEVEGARLDRAGDADPVVVGIGRDVTERERMERELRENERRYRTLVEMSPDPILVHADGEIVYANDALVGFVDAGDREEVLGEHITAFLHPDEREDARDSSRKTQRGEHTPTGNSRTVLTLDGRERHVETTSRPIAYDGDPAVLTVVKDVTHRHRYEEMLTTLLDRARAMTRVQDRDEIAAIAVDTTDELVGSGATVFYGLRDGDGLVPTAWSDDVADRDDGPPTGAETEGALWEAFVEGEERFVEAGDGTIGDLPLRSALILPVGNHGVLVTGVADATTITTTQREVARLVVENSGAAFDRAERERDLRERDRELRRQNETLEQLNRLNEIIREINQTLVRSSTRSGIMDGVCERISAADQYAHAWIGTRDPADGHVSPEHWDGMDPEYVDHLGSADAHAPLHDLVDAAFRENEVRVARDVLDDPGWEDHRSDALNHGYRSVAAVPIILGDHADSVLVIHATDPDLFDERERAVLGELGDTVGYALQNVERSGAIRTGEATEIELGVPDGRLFTNRIAAELECDAVFVGAVPADGDALQVFLRITDVATGGVEERLGELEAVTAVRPLSEGDEGGLYRLTVATPPLFGIAQRNDARLRDLTVEDGVSTVVLVVPGAANVRSFVEEVRAAYPDTELRARRRNAEPVDTPETFRDRIHGQLTERQREALRTAYYSGFYEWPRETRSKDLADMLDIAPSTYQYHLRAAERTVVGTVLDPV